MDRGRHGGREDLTLVAARSEVEPRAVRGSGHAGGNLAGMALRPGVAHALSLLVALLVLVRVNRNAYFFGDDWEFIHRSSTGPLDLFVPHNEHWSTLPLLIYRGLFAAVGVRTYTPYLLVLFAAHLLIAHLLWRQMRAAGVDGWVATSLVGVFLVLGSATENLAWAFQVGFLLALLLSLVQVACVDHDGPWGRRDAVGVVAGVLAQMSAGIAIPLLAVSGLVAWTRRGFRAALATVAVPAAALVIWLLAVGHRGFAGDSTGLDVALHLPGYVWQDVTQSLDRASAIPGVGAVLVMALMVLLVRSAAARPRPPSLAPHWLAVGAILLMAFIGLGRLSNFGGLVSERYIYLVVALLLPGLGVALTMLVRQQFIALLVTAAVLLMAAVQGAGTLRDTAHARADRDQWSEQRILAGADLLASHGADAIGTQPEPAWAPDISTALLRVLAEQGALPSHAAESDDAINYARARLLLAVSPEQIRDAQLGAATVTSVGGVTVAALAGNCAQLTPNGPVPRATVVLSSIGSYDVRVAATTSVALDVIDDGTTADSAPSSGPHARTIPLQGGVSAALDNAESGTTVLLTLDPAGPPVAICGSAMTVAPQP